MEHVMRERRGHNGIRAAGGAHAISEIIDGGAYRERERKIGEQTDFFSR